ncbi:hypothetical protein MMC14_002061 [Varicellaria rhodocarpa]|nr:hypothetical protein [Varicellaria rhodocarpa]
MQLSLCLVLLLPTSAFAAVSTVVVTAAPSAPTNDPSYTSNSDFQNAILNSTNFYRAEHNASAVTWNNSLASFGADYANGCKFQHSGGPDGENLAEGYSNVTDAVDAWGNERAQYNFKKPGFSEATGHFTQLVWKTTTTVGCGRTFCNGKNGVSGW